MSAGLVRSGQTSTTTPFDAVVLNVSAVENVGMGDRGLSINTAPLLEILVACFASDYAATHSLTNEITSTPNTCSATALFQHPFQTEPCFADLCAPRT